MKRPSYSLIHTAARESKRAAIKSSREKYLYLLQLSPKGLKRIPQKFLQECGCAICMRSGSRKMACPLKLNCFGVCIPEWEKMFNAWEKHKTAIPDYDSYYCEFITYAAKIYLKLLEI